MLATAVDAPFSDPDWLFELKLDGYRIQAVVRDGAVQAVDAQPEGCEPPTSPTSPPQPADWIARR